VSLLTLAFDTLVETERDSLQRLSDSLRLLPCVDEECRAISLKSVSQFHRETLSIKTVWRLLPCVDVIGDEVCYSVCLYSVECGVV